MKRLASTSLGLGTDADVIAYAKEHAGPVGQSLLTILSERDADIARYRRGIRKILEYLECSEPRIGDATFDCEALLLAE